MTWLIDSLDDVFENRTSSNAPRLLLITNLNEKVIKQFKGNSYERLANSICSWILSLILFNFMQRFFRPIRTDLEY